MDYKSKLQTNNTELEGNNVDLQSILNTINSLPNATEAVNLDEEITTQEGLIDQIQAALEGKASNSNNGIDTSDATIESGAQMLKDITAYGANGKITGTIPSQTGKAITPTKSSQTAISAGTYVTGDITVNAIPDVYITTTDADATAADIAKDKTAYVNGVKVVGTHECSSGGGDISIVTATIAENDVADYPLSLTIPELIGAKYFIIQGNYLSQQQTYDMNSMDDAGAIYQIIYLNGLIIDTVVAARSISSTAGSASMLCGRINSNGYVFNEDTGTISVNNNGDSFFKISTDTSTTGIAYTVYRIG